MNRFYTQTGDDGFTGLLGEGRVAKDDPRLEALGTIDEASAALGLARASSTSENTAKLVLQVQRDLYHMMAEVAALPGNTARFKEIDERKISWLERQIDEFSQQVQPPKEFILPGDSPASAAFALARTIVRRAERRLVGLLHNKMLENFNLMIYLNRLSAMCFLLELVENQAAGHSDPTLAKGGQG